MQPRSALCIMLVIKRRTYRYFNYVIQTECSEVQFTDKDGPATLAMSCVDEEVHLICCMSGFKSISWYQETSTGQWRDFDRAGRYESK